MSDIELQDDTGLRPEDFIVICHRSLFAFALPAFLRQSVSVCRMTPVKRTQTFIQFEGSPRQIDTDSIKRWLCSVVCRVECPTFSTFPALTESFSLSTLYEYTTKSKSL